MGKFKDIPKNDPNAALLMEDKIILSGKLKECEYEIMRNQNSIETYGKSEFSEGYVRAQTERIQRCLEDKHNERIILQLRIQEVEKGTPDAELQMEKNLADDRGKQHKLQKEERQKQDLERKIAREGGLQAVYTRDRQERQVQRNMRYEIKKAYYNFINISESLPEYLQKNLENMPMNKGYKFRGVIFFGARPREEETHIIFERVSKEVMRIHIWEKDFDYQYEKKGKGKKVLLEKTPRRKKPAQKSLCDNLFF